MNLRTVVAGACSALALSAHAVDKPDPLASLKAANRDACVQAGVRPKDAPKREELVAPYCQCVSDVYWDSVPAASVQELLTQHDSPDIRDNYKTRWQAAKSSCRQKLGF